ncbi:unnamed protein product [Closterium sp. NIES-65]|nr:unnamed protein product [Closterium sp. NIES-65]
MLETTFNNCLQFDSNIDCGLNRKHKSSIGFGAPVRASLRNRSVLDARTAGSLLQSVSANSIPSPSPSFNIPPHPSHPLPTPLERQAESTDLIAYGLILSLWGDPRAGGAACAHRGALVQGSLKAKNALSKQFAKLLAMNNARLHMTEGAVRAIARRAAARNTGARGLRSLLEGLLTEAMYEVPSNLVEAVVLDEASMGHEGEEGEEGKPVPSSLVKAVVLDKASVGHEGEEGGDGVTCTLPSSIHPCHPHQVPSSLVEAVVLDEASVGHEGGGGRGRGYRGVGPTYCKGRARGSGGCRITRGEERRREGRERRAKGEEAREAHLGEVEVMRNRMQLLLLPQPLQLDLPCRLLSSTCLPRLDSSQLLHLPQPLQLDLPCRLLSSTCLPRLDSAQLLHLPQPLQLDLPCRLLSSTCLPRLDSAQLLHLPQPLQLDPPCHCISHPASVYYPFYCGGLGDVTVLERAARYRFLVLKVAGTVTRRHEQQLGGSNSNQVAIAVSSRRPAAREGHLRKAGWGGVAGWQGGEEECRAREQRVQSKGTTSAEQGNDECRARERRVQSKSIGEGGQESESIGERGQESESIGEGGQESESIGEGGQESESIGEGGQESESIGEGGQESESIGEGGQESESIGEGARRVRA